VIGVLIAALTITVVVAAILKAAEYQPLTEPTTTVPGVLLPCTTTGCGRPAVTIAAGRAACDNCAQYLTSRAVGA
jgi:hypothetical protein